MGAVAANVLEKACRVGLGGLFVYSSMGKISDPGVFADAVSRYEVLPEFSLGLFALVMPMLELLAGLALVFTKWTREAALVVSAMLALFMVALAQALVRGLEISCGCFGVPSVGGRQEIALALARDVVLAVPAVWLMSRRNSWLWRRARPAAALLLLATALAGALPAVALTASSGPVRAGEWNLNFTNVLATAEREHRPMVLLQVGRGCLHCARLEKAVSGGAFRLWQQDRAPLLAFVRDNGDRSVPENLSRSTEWIEFGKKKMEGYPHVCVYWPRSDGMTNRTVFCARRGQMGVKKNRLLVAEFMSALDVALATNRNVRVGTRSLRDILDSASKKVSVRAESGGTVSMKPSSGIMPEGKEVVLSAKPEEDWVFLDWLRPDGNLAGRGKVLRVTSAMPEGCYSARFKKLSDCVPPILLSPAETSLCVRIHTLFRYGVKVDDACRPVRFAPKRRLPQGLKLNPLTGVLAGYQYSIGTNTVDIAISGANPEHVTKTVRVTLVVVPRTDVDELVPTDDQDDDLDGDKDNEEADGKEKK